MASLTQVPKLSQGHARVRSTLAFCTSKAGPFRASFAQASVAWLLFLFTAITPGHPEAAEANAPGIEFFERKVRPVLAENCYSCHGEEKQKGGLRLDSPGFIRTGGESGPIVSPGFPDQSRMILAVGYQDEDLKMPPKKRLSSEQVRDLTEWVKLGAPMPAGDAPAPAAARKEFRITDQDRAHWAFQPVIKQTLPAPVKFEAAGNPIDRFILAKLAAKGLTPNPPARRQELIRRATFDLTGLPPSPGEVEEFLADNSPEAWEKLIDRLLNSPRYGEKWARHWLDLVRFAETNSYERDGDKPNAWRFRDYVIRAFNTDKPYDRFIREQLAGDELPQRDNESIIATGYYRLGIWDDEPADRELARYDGLDDIVATTGQVFLGLTVDCARCHNHKMDPISQRDYYGLVAFFNNVNHYRNGGSTDEIPLFANADEERAFETRQRQSELRRKEIQTELDGIEKTFLAGLAETDPERELSQRDLKKLLKEEGQRVLGAEGFARYESLQKDLQGIKREAPPNQALAVTEQSGTPPQTYVLLRGNPAVKGDPVEPQFIEVLNPPKPVLLPAQRSSGRRLALANWISSPNNPLTARVMVNRLWQYHFGRGIVRSPNNFGLQGERPTHPELLDWLAGEFVSRGWSLKAMHRLIMTSAAYRMSSAGQAEALQADPQNDLFWRFDMRRLTAEEIRDSILSLTGTLNLKMYGPGVFVDIPREVMAGQSQPGSGWGHSPPAEQARRSIYIKVKRSLLTPILESFDAAETDRSAPVRFVTTQPTQALGMINGSFLNQQAELLAERLSREAGENVTEQVRLGLQLVTMRPPTQVEVERGVHLIESLRGQDGASTQTAAKFFCLMALNLNELIYLD